MLPRSTPPTSPAAWGTIGSATLAWLPSMDPGRFVQHTADGTRRAIHGGWRVEFGPDRRARFAEDVTADAIHDARPVGDRWAFVTTRGLVATSDTFLGRLRWQGERAARPYAPRAAYCVDPVGATFATQREVERLLAQDRQERHAWFRQPAPRPMDDGWWQFFASSELTRHHSWLLGWRGALLPDGRALLVAGRDEVSVDPASGRELARVVDAFPDDHCNIWLWGSAVMRYCLDRPPWTRGSDGRWGLLPIPAPRDASWHFSNDGVHVAYSSGECAATAASRRARDVLCSYVNGELRNLGALDMDRSAMSVLGGEIVSLELGQRLLHRSLETGQVRGEPIPSPLGGALFYRWPRGQPRDGSVALIGTGAGPRVERVVLAMRSPEGEWSLRPMPAEVLGENHPVAAFADQRRGVVMGEDYRSLFYTEDGGEHWLRVAGRDPWLDRVATRSGERPARLSDREFAATCTSASCSVDVSNGEVAIYFSGSPGIERASILAPSHRLDVPVGQPGR